MVPGKHVLKSVALRCGGESRQSRACERQRVLRGAILLEPGAPDRVLGIEGVVKAGDVLVALPSCDWVELKVIPGVGQRNKLLHKAGRNRIEIGRRNVSGRENRRVRRSCRIGLPILAHQGEWGCLRRGRDRGEYPIPLVLRKDRHVPTGLRDAVPSALVGKEEKSVVPPDAPANRTAKLVLMEHN